MKKMDMDIKKAAKNVGLGLERGLIDRRPAPLS